VSIAAINAPQHVVISGEAAAVSSVLSRLARSGVTHVQLRVSHAFHSPLMEPMLASLEAVAQTIHSRPPRLPLISNVTGMALPGPLPAGYWSEQARRPVQFLAAIRELARLDIDVALELGPSHTLTGLVQRSDVGDRVVSHPSMRRDHDPWKTLSESVAALYSVGAQIDWTAFHRDHARRRMALPTTPFRRSRFWMEGSNSGRSHRRTADSDRHPLLGPPLTPAIAPESVIWQQEISLTQLPYLADHCVRGKAVVPATAYIEMATAAYAERFGIRPIALRDLTFTSALLLDTLAPDARVTVQVTLKGSSDDVSFSVHSRTEGQRAGAFVDHAAGRIVPMDDTLDAENEHFVEARHRCTTELSADAFYSRAAQTGNEWGPSFRGIRELWVGEGEACAVVVAPTPVEDDLDRYVFHPAVADACGHALAAAAMTGDGQSVGGAFVGQAIGEIRLNRPARGRTFRVTARIEERPSRNDVRGNVTILDERGELVGHTMGVTMHRLERAEALNEDWWYGVDWLPVSAWESSATPAMHVR
jgi:myxalamid-type polyketide synthase MxaB